MYFMEFCFFVFLCKSESSTYKLSGRFSDCVPNLYVLRRTYLCRGLGGSGVFLIIKKMFRVCYSRLFSCK